MYHTILFIHIEVLLSSHSLFLSGVPQLHSLSYKQEHKTNLQILSPLCSICWINCLPMGFNSTLWSQYRLYIHYHPTHMYCLHDPLVMFSLSQTLRSTKQDSHPCVRLCCLDSRWAVLAIWVFWQLGYKYGTVHSSVI